MRVNQTASRRRFLGTAAAVLAVPTILPRSVSGANEAIITGHIGVKNQGTSNLRAFLKRARPAALCDVDSQVLAIASALAGTTGREVKGYGDYRKLLDRKDIDAVVISTPDHWHALTTIHACQAGKDVYCEKPLSLTVAEGRQMVDVARKTGRIVQTGSQQRSDARFRRACELVLSGKIGKVTEVLVGIPRVNYNLAPVPDSAPPANLDFDFWLGQAPKKPYNVNHVHYNFRFFWDYSGGQMTNWGAHHLDIAQWGLGMDDSGPVLIEGTATYHPKHWYEVTDTARIVYTYADSVKVTLGQGQKDIKAGVTFVGPDGQIFVDRSKITSQPEGIAKENLSDSDVHLYESKDHHQNFLDCVKSRKRPICDVEIGHRSATVCHLGNIVARLGRKVNWDPTSERIVNDEEASAMLSRPHRSPYTI